ncbi:dynactin subunit 1-like [Gossypium australe]|uniref:Dynactin subunit 1-like n=1 Tax=Gossypium australe TaxID=47621 RepID=A0A5B6WN62_9ROSI|nr:dynactin subunit 1-like [Gossypium australe]
MLGSATKSFSDVVMSGEMIENAIRSGKIDVGKMLKDLPRERKKVNHRRPTKDRDNQPPRPFEAII